MAAVVVYKIHILVQSATRQKSSEGLVCLTQRSIEAV